jgi:hypothetical protein
MASTTTLRDEFSKVMSLKEAAADEEQHSHDSASTDEGAGVLHRGTTKITLNFID